MYIGPDDVYVLALQAIPIVTAKYAVDDQTKFAQILTGMAYQESCIAKSTKNLTCFDTEARPYNSKGELASSAYGITQILKGTQRNIERLMGWPERPLNDRSDPQYAVELAAAYLAYLYNGGDKTPRGDWTKALVAYHDGHYSKKGAGHSYAKLIMSWLPRFDFAGIASRRNNARTLVYNNRAEFR
ncbi:MAG: transglycosylase SLT domain-containing protein [Bacteroidota bacterium]